MECRVVAVLNSRMRRRNFTILLIINTMIKKWKRIFQNHDDGEYVNVDEYFDV